VSTFEVKVHRLIIEPHPNGDRIQIARLEGQDYQMIVGKDQFSTGDLAVYIPEAAVVPDWILEEMGLVGKLDGPQHNRVKAHKFRGVLSQGLAYRPQDVREGQIGTSRAGLLTATGYSDGKTRACIRVVRPETAVLGYLAAGECPTYVNWEEGEEVGEALGISKYEPPIPAHFAGVWGPAPNHHASPGGSIWQGYTHLENIKKFPHILVEGEPVVMTEKLHGTSLQTLFDADADKLYVSSLGIARKGYTLEEDPENVYWEIAHRYDLARKLADIALWQEASQVMLFGEIVGVQDLKYGLVNGATALFVFDCLIKGHNTSRADWLSHDDLVGTCKRLGLPVAPVVYEGPFTRELLLQHTGGTTLVTGATHIREGVVVRPLIEREESRFGRVVLKSISADYLTRKEGTEYT
jgi:RNA ligase (TIGR02306 family)